MASSRSAKLSASCACRLSCQSSRSAKNLSRSSAPSFCCTSSRSPDWCISSTVPAHLSSSSSPTAGSKASLPKKISYSCVESISVLSSVAFDPPASYADRRRSSERIW